MRTIEVRYLTWQDMCDEVDRIFWRHFLNALVVELGVSKAKPPQGAARGLLPK